MSKMSRMSAKARFGVAMLFYTLLIATCVFSGCKPPQPKPGWRTNLSQPLQQYRPLLFIVLLDETGLAESVGVETKNEHHRRPVKWSQLLQCAQRIVGSMQPDDAIVVIGIDNDSRQTEDIRLAFKQAPPEQVRLGIWKRELYNELKNISKRPVTYQGSDILGALYQGQYFATGHPSHKAVIIGFTDLEQQDEKGRELVGDAQFRREAMEKASKYMYPKGTEAAFFYVAGHDMARYNELVRFWRGVLAEMGVMMKPLEETEPLLQGEQKFQFWVPGDSEIALQQFLQMLSSSR